MNTEVIEDNKDGVATVTATNGKDDSNHEEIDMATVAAIFEEKKCSVCGGDKFWTRQDGVEICAVCHPPVTPVPGK